VYSRFWAAMVIGTSSDHVPAVWSA
jgi:hypothetical protein